MTTIVCKSGFLASEIASITGTEDTLVFPSDSNTEAVDSSVKWLADCLRTHRVSCVLYESRFFVDPSQFRALSPKTKFILLSSPGDEDNARTALVCGAYAVIDKPLSSQDVLGVLSLASQ